MKKTKRYWWAAAAAILLLIATFFLLRPASGSGTYENLVINGDFESLDEDALPVGWYTDAYFDLGYTEYGVASGVEGNGARIVNTTANDARFAQTVAVSPDTLYRLHGFVRADAAGGLGANLSIEGVYVFSESVYDTGNDWQEVTLYGRTDSHQHTVTIFARLGGYSGEAAGEACFDNITLCRVDSVPSGAVTYDWFPTSAASAREDGEKTGGTGWLPVGSIAYLGLFLLISLYLRSHDRTAKIQQPKKRDASLLLWAGALLAAFAVRLFLAVRVPGYDVDVTDFRSWAGLMAQVGPARFYQSGWCDYPPGYMLVLWLVGGAARVMGSEVTELMIKIPPILADMALCVLLYTEGKKRVSEKTAMALSLLYAFNPLTFVNSAAWGQADSLMLLLLFLVLVFAVRGQWKWALPLYMLSVLVKPQALMFGPLGLGALIVHMARQWKDAAARKALLRDVGLGLLLTAAAGLAVVLPFAIYQEPAWIFNLYGSTMGQYGYATVNACNLYFLLGKNWVGASAIIGGDWFIPLIAFLLSVLPLAAAAVLKGFKTLWADPASRLRLYVLAGLALGLGAALTVLAMLGQLTYASLGTCMIAYAVILFIALYVFGGKIELLPLLGAAMLMLLFSVGSMMHERYLFPVIGLLFLAYMLQKDRRILWLAVGVTVTGLLNVGCVLLRNIAIGGAAGHLSAPAVGLSSDTAALEYFSAIGNCLLAACSLALSCAHALGWEAEGEAAEPIGLSSGCRPVSPLPVTEPLRPMTKKDWAVMAIVTVLYAALAFTNLGSMKAPQTAWVSVSEEEEILLDLGEEKTFHLLYYPGIHYRADWETSEFSVSASSDGTYWADGYEGSVKGGSTFDVFKWKYLGMTASSTYPVDMTGRYVRITANFSDLTLYEVLLRDAVTGETIPIAGVTDSVGNGTAAFLTDEQDTLEGEPGWYNSTYFDEIYHARTAYEHLHALPAYETTHPPLGKVLMSFAVAIFGMTPFGWRFAGTLAGVLMLPGMYLLGKMLIRKKWGGFAAMMLLALDLMHFTQTRIATIDSFVVLFIIWMVYFMLRWFFQDFFGKAFWKTLIPLALSGLCMGLGVASKWTGCYAGAGLAILFFWGIYRRYREVKAAREIPEKERTEAQRAAAKGGKNLLITVASCLIFFVAVPLIIYYASYIPYFAGSGGVTVQKIIQAAEGMLSYHSTPGLGMDHYFYSPWYQWPVIGKPMWYASNAFEPLGMESTIMALGNPAVWWGGLIGLFGILFVWIRRHYDEKNHVLSLYTAQDDPRYAVLLICFAAQYLPWVPVPRGTYIYHYFPSVPFIILCAALALDRLAEKHEHAVRIAVYLLILLAGVLFIAFFPYASGVTVSQKWLDAMKWFPNWLYY